MIEKYGKDIRMSRLGRSIEKVMEHNNTAIRNCERFFRADSRFDGKCRICGGTETSFLVKMNNQYEYYQCHQCGCVVLGNLPNVEEIYTDADDTGNIKEYIDDSIFNARVEMITKPKVEFVLEAANELGMHIESWLDIGCSGGELLFYITEKYKNIQARGIECDPFEVKFAKKKGLEVYEAFVDVKKNDAAIANMLRESSVVSFINTLEHVEHPQEYIDFFYDNMKSGSLLVIEVPRYPSVASFANLTNPSIVYRHITPPIHLQIFTEKAMDLLFDGKFEMLGKWGFGQGYTDLLVNAMINAGLKENNLYHRVCSIANEVQRVMDSNGLADQMIYVARRK